MEKINEFENAVIAAVTELRDGLGAKRINISVQVDQYEKSCKIDVTFFKSIANDASICAPALKAD